MVRRAVFDRNILFLCQDNACLSLIAEAIARRLSPPRTQVFSAGLKPQGMDPRVRTIMEEVGINVSSYRPKGLDAIPVRDIDLIIVLGKLGARPVFPSQIRCETWPLIDPYQESQLNLETLRTTRDEINNRVAGLFLDYWRNIT